MRKLSRRSKTVLAYAVVAAIAVNAGTAWAYWRVKSTATVTSTAGSVSGLQAAGVPVGKPLHPGAHRDISITVVNPNAFPVRVTQITRSTKPVVVDAAHATAGCLNSGVQLTNAAYAVAWNLPQGGKKTFTLSKAISMTNASDSACQGATFELSILVTGKAA